MTEPSGEADDGGSDAAAEPPATTGNVFVNCSTRGAGQSGMRFGKGAGRNYFYGTTFEDNATDITVDGAVGQSFYGTKFLKDSQSAEAPPPPERRSRGKQLTGFTGRLPGKACRICGFNAFRWQTRCPKGHPLT